MRQIFIPILAAVSFIFKLFFPFLLSLTVIKVFELSLINSIILILVSIITVIYEIQKVIGLDIIIKLFNMLND
jgi:hypothetical protein